MGTQKVRFFKRSPSHLPWFCQGLAIPSKALVMEGSANSCLNACCHRPVYCPSADSSPISYRPNTIKAFLCVVSPLCHTRPCHAVYAGNQRLAVRWTESTSSDWGEYKCNSKEASAEIHGDVGCMQEYCCRLILAASCHSQGL